MIVSTTVIEREVVVYTRKVYFETESLEEARSMSAEKVLAKAVRFDEAECFIDSLQKLDPTLELDYEVVEV